MQAEFKSNLVKNLPDAFKKTTDSNNFKILEIERITCNDLRDSLRAVSDILDINNATGKTLDMYGDRVGQPRGLATDDKYLLMIKAKILRNISNGSYPSVINAICQTFNCKPSQVVITENEETCTVTVAALPLDIITTAGLTTSQTVAIIKSLLPIGVTMQSFMFDGTFEFSANENDYDETKGFSDVEGGTIGGYLGATNGDTSDEILPI